ncbi:hypothetical protein [Flavobacterium sp.]|uniref:NACHT domain-containing protein n=1 Tax=Flavobacterium sp. TaxID=239 RepID=UPI00286CF43E|nr:hypothetical protein [Flavobacterium sp.]
MTSQQIGSSFEIITQEFFVWLFEKIGFTVTQTLPMKSGNQNGFDILIMISKDYNESRIFIECKNYKSDVAIGNILKKGLNLESNYTLDRNDLFIAINPRSNFSNDDNSEKLSPTLSEKFKFSYYQLDLSNGIKELFALNNSFYKQLYGKDVDFAVDEEKEIERFKSIILSRKPFKKVLISEKDKSNYLGDIKLTDNLIEREFSEDKTDGYTFLWDEDKRANELIKILEKESKIFLLGNPGTGKTTELMTFALKNWKTGEVQGSVPIFRNLRDFTNTDTIEDYLPPQIDELSNVLLILDGIDEIADIEYFKSKLVVFLSKEDNSDKYKCIISCRTNVYESIVKDIKGFKKYYLKDLSRYKSLKLLTYKCGSIIDSLSFNEMLYDFLKTPFQVEILANYINQYKKTPLNTFELWETYINTRLTHDKNDKLKKVELNTPLIKKFSKKISLINELMKSNIITEDNLFCSIKDNTSDFNEFKKNPLIDKKPGLENYFFEHRNIQEYFAAELISSLDFEEIKKFILIDGTDKTHPSLFNTVTFLINILSDAKYDSLVQWFIDNQPELLFKADKNRISNFRVKVFQGYFQSECIEKTYWINNSKVSSVKEIAEFGNCEENFDYLNTIINDNTSHFRVRISALDLLGHFTIPTSKKEKLKNDLFGLLKSTTEDIKSHILDFIYDQKLCESDNKYLEKIFELFKKETSKQINKALLSLIEKHEPIDDFFWYVKDEFLRDKKIIPRDIVDDVMRGNSWTLEQIIIRFKSSAHFIEFAKYYFDENTNNFSDNKFAEEIIEKCLHFDNSEEGFLVDLLSSFEDKTKYHLRENYLRTLILKSKPESQIAAFQYLIKNFTSNNVGYFLASITNEKTIDIVIENFKDGSIESKDLDFYRNVIANHGNRELAGKFNNTMIEAGFTFNHQFLFEKEFAVVKAKSDNKAQENFDLLFNKRKLLSKIKKIFDENGELIDEKKIRTIDMKWYDNNGHGSTIDMSYTVLSRIIYDIKDSLDYNEVKKILKNPLVIISKIKSQVEGLKNSGDRFVVRENQKEFIQLWCTKVSQKIRFDKIMQSKGNHFVILEDYEKLKLVLFFMHKLNFELSQEFYLNSMEFFDVEKSSDEDKNFQKLSKRISDKKQFDERIIYNLLNRDLTYITLSKHIQYALDNNLVATFDKIRQYLFSASHSFNIDKKLEQLYQLTNDIYLLKDCCVDAKSHHCWSALKIMMDFKLEPEFCIKKAIEFLEAEIDPEKNYYYSNALAILFELNSLNALKYLFSFLNQKSIPSLKENSYTHYNTIADYNILEKLFKIIYLEDRGHIGFSGLSSFLTTYVSNLSKSTEGYKKTFAKLIEIKAKLETAKSDTGIFYINKLIDDATDGYVNSKSKALNFREALSKVEQILA